MTSAGGTFESDTPGTFHSVTDGTFVSAVGGTFQSDMGGTFAPLLTFEHGENGDILVQKAPACTIQTQAEAVCELFGCKKEDIKVICIRHGEKMYETLLTNEECAKAVDMGNFYRAPDDNRTLNYDKYFTEGDQERVTLTEFNSNNTRRLNLEETKEKIAILEYIQNALKGITNAVN